MDNLEMDSDDWRSLVNWLWDSGVKVINYVDEANHHGTYDFVKMVELSHEGVEDLTPKAREYMNRRIEQETGGH
tara:strand:+ start:717 stop:938 length:222 start_codon:yes stop_codon:yes gene_type:complete